MFGTTFSNLGRLRQITSVVARHGLGHYLERRRRSGPRAPDFSTPSSDEYPASAQRFRAILEDLGPTFIKFGQILSTRADLLPPGFAEALSSLQDDCPPMSTAEMYRAIEEGLGAPVADLFAFFEEKPIASASIAQVHRAITKNGDEVAVKIQRLNIRAQIIRDIDLIAYLARIAENIIEESGVVTARDFVSEFEHALLRELDFKNEAAMIRRFHENMAGKQRCYVVPKVYDDLSSDTVLTLEFMRGARIGDLKPHHDKRQVLTNIITSAFVQVFEDGLFHADPHPGNSFILDDNRIVLIDFGSVGQISYAMRETLVVLVVAITMRDADAVARLLYRIGIPEERVLLHRLRDAVASLFSEYLRDRHTIANVEAAQILRELFNLAARFKVRIPAEYALIGRASMTIEGVIRQLDPTLEVLDLAGPIVKKLIDERFSMPDVGDTAIKNIIRARDILRELPIMLSQILMDMEAGKLRVSVDNPKFDTIARNIDSLGQTIFMGLLVSGLVTGSLFILARYDWELWGLPAVPVVALWIASLIVGAGMGRQFLAPRLRKWSIGRWLNKRRRR